MEKLADRTFWWIELFAGLGFMTVGFFQDCSLTFGTAIISLAITANTVSICRSTAYIDFYTLRRTVKAVAFG